MPRILLVFIFILVGCLNYFAWFGDEQNTVYYTVAVNYDMKGNGTLAKSNGTDTEIINLAKTDNPMKYINQWVQEGYLVDQWIMSQQHTATTYCILKKAE